MDYQHEYKERRENTKPLKPVVMPAVNEELDRVMIHYLESRCLSAELAILNGWYPSEDYGTPRLIIPASTATNTWPYYQARAMLESPIRYKSPSAPRGDALVVVYPEGKASGVVIVEGPMDALAAAGEGFVGVGLMGNTPGDDVLNHLESILKTFPGTCLVIPDRDALSKGAEVTAKLWTRNLKCELRPIQGAKDLAELSPSQRSLLLNA